MWSIIFSLIATVFSIVSIVGLVLNIQRLVVVGTIISLFSGMRSIPFVQTPVIITTLLAVRLFVCLIIAGIVAVLKNDYSFMDVFWSFLCVWTAWVAVKNLFWIIIEKCRELSASVYITTCSIITIIMIVILIILFIFGIKFLQMFGVKEKIIWFECCTAVSYMLYLIIDEYVIIIGYSGVSLDLSFIWLTAIALGASMVITSYKAELKDIYEGIINYIIYLFGN